MKNLREAVERGWQVGFSHFFASGDKVFWETVGLQKWKGYYKVHISKIDENKYELKFGFQTFVFLKIRLEVTQLKKRIRNRSEMKDDN